MGPISGFTVALPFLIVIFVYMVKQHELDHIRKKSKTELNIIAVLLNDSFKRADTGSGDIAKSYFVERIKESEADGKLSKISCGILLDGLLKKTQNTN